MLSRMLIIGWILLMPVYLFAQQTAVQNDNQTIAQELESVIIEAKNVDNKNALVVIQSRAAMLLSFSDPARSEKMFLNVWKFINRQPDSDFDKQQAKLVVLKYLFPRNAKLARELLAEKPKTNGSTSPAPADDDQRQAAKLASQLVDVDPSVAASLLERSLSTSATIAGIGALSRLREKDSFLSDYIAAKTLEALTARPTLISLSGLQLLAGYVFPGPDTVMFSMDAESSLRSLQFKYFLVGYDTLKASLSETNELLLKDYHYTEGDLQFRAANQAIVAGFLAALAPRYQPSLAAELNAIAAKRASQIPPGLSQIQQLALAKLSGNRSISEEPEQNLIYAMSSGDYDEADKQLDRISDEKKKIVYRQLLLKTHARTLLAQSDVLGALVLIRKLEDEPTRLVMYLDAVKAANKKRESDLTHIIINEARLLVPQTDRNGLHVRALLSFVAQLTDPHISDDAFEILNNAVVGINALSKKSKPDHAAKSMAEAAMAELNDPQNLLDAPEMEQAFSTVGLLDLDRGLIQAKSIDLLSLQLATRLETLQGVIKRDWLQRKSKVKQTETSASPKP